MFIFLSTADKKLAILFCSSIHGSSITIEFKLSLFKAMLNTNVDFGPLVDWSGRHEDSCGRSETGETPQTRSVEEAGGRPRKAKCLERKSTTKFNRALFKIIPLAALEPKL